MSVSPWVVAVWAWKMKRNMWRKQGAGDMRQNNPDRGLHSLPLQLNLSSSVQCITQVRP